jgi:NADH-quinone oxidoreductase subunit L
MIGASIFWLAPVLPLAAFVCLVIGLARWPRLAAGLAIASVAGAVIVSGLGLAAAAQGARPTVAVPWLAIGGRQLTFALWLDPLSALAATLVAVVGLVVFVYAVAYMAGDPRFGRFYSELSLFIAAMLALVLAGDLITLFIAWELVGLSSYLLIGFWFERPGVPPAATQALLTTCLADLAMLAGVLLVIGVVGSGRIAAVLAAASSGQIAHGLLLSSALLLLIGAAGKSAQAPFQGWLPDAMVGPTPVSALLHSATMVAAGVFLIARLYPLFLAASPALGAVGWLGAITALLAAVVALVQADLKRLLAYSTISQIGLMFVGLGSGSLLAGMLLLTGHALYKTSLFLAAGTVDHAVGGTGFARMGGLAHRMPYTAAMFAIGAAALAGLPVTLALPSKDPALAAAWGVNPALFAVALLASLLTALYSARAFSLAFLGPPSVVAQRAHEAARSFLAPMLALAGLIILGLLMDAALAGYPLGHLLGAATPETAAATGLTLGVALAGAGLGFWVQSGWPGAIIWPALARVAPLLTGEFGLKALYRAVSQLAIHVATAVGTFDRVVFDAFATRAARGILSVVRAGGRFDQRGLDAAIHTSGQALLTTSQRLRRLQTGRVENYLLGIFIWGLGLLALAVFAMARH